MASKYLHKPLLLSGGLDSSILCSIIKPDVSIVISFGDNSLDLHYSRIVAEKYSKSHVEKIINFETFQRLVPNVVKILKTFDPIEIRNSCVIYAGITEAKKIGQFELVTGDGADELFAGYNYLHRYYSNLPNLQDVLVDLWKYMRFSSLEIGSALNMKVCTPYLEEPFISFAMGIDIREKVGKKMGTEWGKFILRKAFELELGALVWRKKMALEKGSKMDKVSGLIERKVTKDEFESEKKRSQTEQVIINSKEQMYYYQVYRTFFPPPCNDVCGSFRCPYCAACITRSKRYCNTCGAFPIDESKGIAKN